MEDITESDYNYLLNSTKDIELFSLNKRIMLGKVVDVYDGDTCKIVLFLGNGLKKFTVRMMGYDCPEMKTKNLIEKKFGQRSKKIFSEMIENRIVKIECLEFDKYGRLLGNIFLMKDTKEEFCINTFMVDNHLGFPYFGDTKKTFDDLLKEEYYYEKNVDIPKTINYQTEFKIKKEIETLNKEKEKDNKISSNVSLNEHNEIKELNENLKKEIETLNKENEILKKNIESYKNLKNTNIKWWKKILKRK
jgi:endonuclease YncB( thermonuclease family)